MKKLDKLQLIKRGNIFKHCLLTVIVLLLLYALLLQFEISLLQHQIALILIIIFTISQFCVEMILCDIYPLTEKRQRFLYYLLGVVGLFIIVVASYDLVAGRADIIGDKMLTNTGAVLIMGCFFLVVFLTYTVKRIYNKKREDVS